MMLEQSDQLMEDLSENSDHPDEVGEGFLQQIHYVGRVLLQHPQ